MLSTSRGSVVLGHSLGAMVVLELTQRAPEVVGAVVMVDPPPLSKEVWKDFAAELIPSFQGPSGPAGRRQFVEQMFLPTDDAERRGVYHRFHVRCPQRHRHRDGLGDGCLRLGRGSPRTCEVAGPRLSHRRFRPTIRAFLLDANPTIVTGQTVGAGHFHQLDVPDQLNSMIERFLATVPSGPTDWPRTQRLRRTGLWSCCWCRGEVEVPPAVRRRNTVEDERGGSSDVAGFSDGEERRGPPPRRLERHDVA